MSHAIPSDISALLRPREVVILLIFPFRFVPSFQIMVTCDPFFTTPSVTRPIPCRPTKES